jgi:hypothetical protein
MVFGDEHIDVRGRAPIASSIGGRRRDVDLEEAQIASNPALCPPDTMRFGNLAAAGSASGSSVCHIGRPRRTSGVRGTRAAASVPTACKKRRSSTSRR